jgi:hypothetical protein
MMFRTGRLLATPAALEAIQRAGQHPLFFLERHVKGDWGEIGQEDWLLNDNEGLRGGGRLLPSYRTLTGESVWIITEAVGDDGQRAAMTILLPQEY